MGSKLVEEGASTLAASSSPSKGASVGLVPLRRPKGFVVWFQSLPGAKNFRVIAVTLDADVPEFTGSRAAFSVVPVSADGQLRCSGLRVFCSFLFCLLALFGGMVQAEAVCTVLSRNRVAECHCPK